MNETLQRIQDRVKKLMTLAKDGGATEGEVKAALRQAKALMDKYNIEEVSVIVEDASAFDEAYKTMTDETVWQRSNEMEDQDVTLASAIGQLCDCGCYTTYVWGLNQRKRRAYMHQVHFFGLRVDVAIASALYREIFVVMRTMARAMYGPKYGNLHRSYMRGFAQGVQSQVWHLQSQQAQDAAGTSAIVLSKKALRQRYGEEHFGWMTDEERKAYWERMRKEREEREARGEKEPEVKYRKTREKRINEDAFFAGSEAGRSVSLATNTVKGDANGSATAGQTDSRILGD